ncbi:MAG: hypothetical protein ABIR18_03540 [Chitinophagaceae bacterium]
MKRIIPVVLATVLFASCKKDSNSIAGKDINTAEKVSVDRFSAAAGHLMVRTAANGLPAANAPVNFDNPPFITKGFAPNGAVTEYYNFDTQPLQPVNIYVFFKSGATSPVAGQNNVIPVIPGDAGYNDFWVVNKINVPDNYVPNSLTSESEVLASGYTIQKTSAIVNCPVVPFGSVAGKKYGGGSNALSIGWYKGKAVAYFSFEEKALIATASGQIPVSPIYVIFNDNAAGPSSGFKTEAGTVQTHNVLATTPGSASYSPLWSVNVIDNAAFSSVTNLSNAQSSNILGMNVALVNCPVVK